MKSSIQEEKSFDTLESQISCAIKNSMKFQLLSERFLWVNCLCIIQDDIDQKYNQIKLMGVIYGRAILTIIAYSGESSHCSLPGVTDGRRCPRATAQLHGRRLLATPTTLPIITKYSPYKRRAWTFQERLLFKRCLYLSHHQAYFSCGAGVHPEDLETDPKIDYWHSTIRNPLISYVRASMLPDSRPLHACRFANTYFQLVQNYALRHLSYPVYIWNTFSGMMVMSEEMHEHGTSLSGLPEYILDMVLLWLPVRP